LVEWKRSNSKKSWLFIRHEEVNHPETNYHKMLGKKPKQNWEVLKGSDDGL
jgi:hypothetical protein